MSMMQKVMTVERMGCKDSQSNIFFLWGASQFIGYELTSSRIKPRSKYISIYSSIELSQPSVSLVIYTGACVLVSRVLLSSTQQPSTEKYTPVGVANLTPPGSKLAAKQRQRVSFLLNFRLIYCFLKALCSSEASRHVIRGLNMVESMTSEYNRF